MTSQNASDVWHYEACFTQTDVNKGEGWWLVPSQVFSCCNYPFYAQTVWALGLKHVWSFFFCFRTWRNKRTFFFNLIFKTSKQFQSWHVATEPSACLIRTSTPIAQENRPTLLPRPTVNTEGNAKDFKWIQISRAYVWNLSVNGQVGHGL